MVDEPDRPVESLETWFHREIFAHEAELMRFLSRKWSQSSEVQDLRHDIYIRVLEAAEKHRPAAARAFLFRVARNLLIDRARRARIVSIDLLEDIDSLNVLVDEISPEERTGGRQQLQRLAKLFDRLPSRCREVVWMRRIEDLSQKEIAARLGITEATVEKHLVRGARLLADAFYGTRQTTEQQSSDSSPRHEPAQWNLESRSKKLPPGG